MIFRYPYKASPSPDCAKCSGKPRVATNKRPLFLPSRMRKRSRSCSRATTMRYVLPASIQARTSRPIAPVSACARHSSPIRMPFSPQGRAAPAGVRFDKVGSVALYPGEPCAPQIMFSFRSAGSTVLLGAPKYQTKVLTEAAKDNQPVHISGKWRRGGHSNCSYVEVTSAEVTR